MIDGYPFSDLEAYIASHYELDDDQEGQLHIDGATPHHKRVPWVIAGVTRNAWLRWRRSGRVPFRAADAVGVEIAGHPSRIWPTWFDDGLEMELCEWCHEAPVRTGSQHSRFCSDDCTYYAYLAARRLRRASA